MSLGVVLGQDHAVTILMSNIVDESIEQPADEDQQKKVLCEFCKEMG